MPDYTTLCRWQKTLAVHIPYRRADGPLNLPVDNTGIKFLGDGEWQVRKHGVQSRRQSLPSHGLLANRERARKVHLAMDTATPDIRAVKFTPSSDGDSPVLPELLDHIFEGEAISTVTAPSHGLPKQTVAGQRMGPMTRAAATRRSSTGRLPRSSRSAKTGDRGRKTARPQSPETKPCAPSGTTDGRSGNVGPGTMPAAGSRQRCAA